MKAKIKKKKYISTGVAFISLLAMWFFYYFGSMSPGLPGLLIFGLGIMLFLSTIVPAAFVKFYEKGSLSDLGIHTRKIKSLVGISSFFGIGSLFYYFQLSGEHNLSLGAAMQFLLWSMLMIWEVLFVFGWLQIRYERAFGAVAGAIATGMSFALYHVGTVPIEQLMVLFFVGLFCAIVFKLAGKSIFVLWPFFWGVGIAISAIQAQSDIVVSPLQIISASVLLVIQVLFIAYWFKRRTY